MDLIFVVDDDVTVGRALGRLLHGAGYRARVFASGEQAMVALSEDRPACLVIDVHMPGCSGVELFQMLRAVGLHSPVIFISGDAHAATAARMLNAGAVHFLAKPFDDDALLHAVAAAIAPLGASGD